MAHAFNDWNVVPEHSVRIYEALKGRVPLQAYYHQGGHGGAPPLEMMNKWFTRYLYGVENGVEKDPKAWIVRENAARAAAGDSAGRCGRGRRGRGRGAARRRRRRTRTIRIPTRRSVTLRLRSGGARARRARRSRPPPKQGTETLVDNVEHRRRRRSRAAETSPHRLLYATPELTEPVHISGHARRSRCGSRRASRPRTCRCGSCSCRGPRDRSARRT